jgi:hypothetical protein
VRPTRACQNGQIFRVPNPEDVLHAEEVEPEPDLDVEPLTEPTLVRPFAMAPSTSLHEQRKHC